MVQQNSPLFKKLYQFQHLSVDHLTKLIFTAHHATLDQKHFPIRGWAKRGCATVCSWLEGGSASKVFFKYCLSTEVWYHLWFSPTSIKYQILVANIVKLVCNHQKFRLILGEILKNGWWKLNFSICDVNSLQMTITVETNWVNRFSS